MKNVVLGFVLAVLVSACSTMGFSDKAIPRACAIAASAVQVLDIAKGAGKLSDEEKALVDEAIAKVDPVCSAEVQPSLESVELMAFHQAVDLLYAAAKED
jgi:hypothetical protein